MRGLINWNPRNCSARKKRFQIFWQIYRYHTKFFVRYFWKSAKSSSRNIFDTSQGHHLKDVFKNIFELSHRGHIAWEIILKRSHRKIVLATRINVSNQKFFCQKFFFNEPNYYMSWFWYFTTSRTWYTIWVSLTQFWDDDVTTRGLNFKISGK